MHDTLALFPLQIVVFPDERLNLHIFEPRYKQLIQDCVTEGISFGINTFMKSELQSIGTEVKLLAIEKEYDNGELDIRTRAIGVYRLEEYFPTLTGKMYAGGEISRMNYEYEGPMHLTQQLLELVGELYRLYEVDKALPKPETPFLSYQLAHYLGLKLEQEYDLLCMKSEEERLNFLLFHVQGLLPGAREVKSLKDRVRLNGHFKNLISPGI